MQDWLIRRPTCVPVNRRIRFGVPNRHQFRSKLRRGRAADWRGMRNWPDCGPSRLSGAASGNGGYAWWMGGRLPRQGLLAGGCPRRYLQGGASASSMGSGSLRHFASRLLRARMNCATTVSCVGNPVPAAFRDKASSSIFAIITRLCRITAIATHRYSACQKYLEKRLPVACHTATA